MATFNTPMTWKDAVQIGEAGAIDSYDVQVLNNGKYAVATLTDGNVDVRLFDETGEFLSRERVTSSAEDQVRMFVHEDSFSVAINMADSDDNVRVSFGNDDGEVIDVVTTEYFGASQHGGAYTGLADGGIAFAMYETDFNWVTLLSIWEGVVADEMMDFGLWVENADGSKRFENQHTGNSSGLHGHAGEAPMVSLEMMALSNGNFLHIINDDNIRYIDALGGPKMVILDEDGWVLDKVEIRGNTTGVVVEEDGFLIQLRDGTLQRYTNEGDLLHDDVSYLAENLPIHSDVFGKIPLLTNAYLEDGRSVEAENVDGTLTVSITDYRGHTIQGDGEDNEIHARKIGGTVEGFSGDDLIHGNDGEDRLYGGYGDDTINGGDGHDVIAPSWGYDVVDGGEGTDWLDVKHYDGGYEIDLATGETRWAQETATNFENIETGDGDDKITGTDGENWIYTNGGHDTIDASWGDDKIEAGAGNDIVQGGRGRDWMDGGDDYDTLVTTEFNGTYEVNLETGETNWEGETALNFEAVITGNGDDRIVGTSGANEITTNGGHDFIDAGWGNDTIDAGAGNDTVQGGRNRDVMDGGEGFDTLITTEFDGVYEVDLNTGETNWASETAVNFEAVITGNGNDRIIGTEEGNFINTSGGHDYIDAGGGNDTVQGGRGRDEMYGGSGIDTLITTEWNGAYDIDLNTGETNWAGETAEGFENVVTGDGDNEITGTWRDNEITTNGGTDIVDAGDGHDTVTLEFDRDQVDGGDGFDKIVMLSDETDYLFQMESGAVRTGNTWYGGSYAKDFESAQMGGGNDTVEGTDARNVLAGGDGDDDLSGGRGRDSLFGENGNDILKGGGGNDFVSGGDGDDMLLGETGNDRLFGNDGADTVDGGLGADTIGGGEGADTLTGGEHADVFIFAKGDGADVITDFVAGTDVVKFDFDGIPSVGDLLMAADFRQVGNDVEIDMGAGDSLLLEDVAMRDLSVSDVLFA